MGWYKQTVDKPNASLSADRRGSLSMPDIISFKADPKRDKGGGSGKSSTLKRRDVKKRRGKQVISDDEDEEVMPTGGSSSRRRTPKVEETLVETPIENSKPLGESEKKRIVGQYPHRKFMVSDPTRSLTP